MKERVSGSIVHWRWKRGAARGVSREMNDRASASPVLLDGIERPQTGVLVTLPKVRRRMISDEAARVLDQGLTALGQGLAALALPRVTCSRPAHALAEALAGDPQNALVLSERGLATGDPSEKVLLLEARAAARMALGEPALALGDLGDALALVERSLDREIEARLRIAHGWALLSLGREEEAVAEATRAESAARAAHRPIAAACAGVVRSVAWLATERFAEAISLLEAAASELRRLGAVGHAANARVYAAVGALMLHDRASASLALRAAAAELEAHDGPSTRPPSLRVWASVLEALELGPARVRAALEPLGALAQRPSDRARLEALRGYVQVADRGQVEPAAASPWIEVRLVARAVRACADSARRPISVPAPRPRLRVDPRRHTFELDGREVSVASHALLEGLLLVLVKRRLEQPGAVVRSTELLAAGWPKERILPRAAKMRLHTAIRRLRRLGLDAHLCTSPEGYQLSPAIDVELVG